MNLLCLGRWKSKFYSLLNVFVTDVVSDVDVGPDVIIPYYLLLLSLWFMVLLWTHVGVGGHQALLLWAFIYV